MQINRDRTHQLLRDFEFETSGLKNLVGIVTDKDSVSPLMRRTIY